MVFSIKKKCHNGVNPQSTYYIPGTQDVVCFYYLKEKEFLHILPSYKLNI